MIDESILTREERTGLALRSLYSHHGYELFRMSKFEEYDLYAKNKDFLLSQNIITFTDMNGRLLALKPDVTLSIVRSGRDTPGAVQKVYYNENVYRSGAGKSFKEIMQVGVECIGEVDNTCVGEVLQLAAESLRTISEECIISISDLDIVSYMMERLQVPAENRPELMRCIGEKNMHGLAKAAESAGLDDAGQAELRKLAEAYGKPSDVFAVLESIPGLQKQSGNLREAVASLEAAGFEDMIRIDFSVTGDTRYYNGIVFRGYVSGVPDSVISGGRYDRLMIRMGRTADAIGFAVYLSTLEALELLKENGGSEH